jgi:predicted nucleic acid-binding protein
VKSTTAFWDASALVPLCVRESASRFAASHLRKFLPVVWWGSLVEVQSTICRLRRDDELSGNGMQGALARLQLLSRGWKEILPGDPLRELALQLLGKFPLRAADSLQLAASLTWCNMHPSGKSFVCGDKKLSAAAKSAGFSVIEL